MNPNHRFQIDKLKKNFRSILNLSSDIFKNKKTINVKLNRMKDSYNLVIKNNNKKIFLFCLDSFYFQYKNYVIESENMDRMRLLIMNRMYCDYYKLYNIIIKFVKQQKKELDLHDLENDYPIYKDLEPFIEYKSHDLNSIHNNILALIDLLYIQTNSNLDNITHYNDTNQMGFSISNFLNTLGYENNLLKEQTELYINYICFFHISQKKQLKSIYNKILDFDKEIDANMNINKTYSIDDIMIQECEIITYTDENNIQQLVNNFVDDIPHDDSNDYINNEEPIKEEPIKEEPIKEEPIKEEIKKEEPKKEEPKKEEPKKEEPKKDEPKKRKKMTMGI